MTKLLAGILLSTLLLAQAAKAPLMLQWQRLANESFTALFCVNQDLEPAPMCFGSCQLEDLTSEMTDGAADDGTMSAKPISPAGAVYCLIPYTNNEPGVVSPPAPPRLKPATVPHVLPRDYVGAVFEPPTRA